MELSAAIDCKLAQRISQQIMDKVQIIVTGAIGSMGSKAVCALGKGEAVRKRIQKEVPSAALQLMQVDMASLGQCAVGG